jgi:hypothetical protein
MNELIESLRNFENNSDEIIAAKQAKQSMIDEIKGD